MSDMIERVCCAHLETSKNDPLVTATDDGVWAYCAGGAADGHDWRRIKPTAIDGLRTRPRQRLQELVDAGSI
jgi:hypothetical protein